MSQGRVGDATTTVSDLLGRAAAVGLRLSVEGERLVIRGPRSASAVAEALLGRKADVLEALRRAERRPPAWDADRAAAVLAECEAASDAALPSLTPPQRNVAEVFRGVARRYAERGDPFLWTYPEFLADQFARWAASRAAARK